MPPVTRRRFVADLAAAGAMPMLSAGAASKPPAGAAARSSPGATPGPPAGAPAPPEPPADTFPANRLFIGCRVDRAGRYLASIFDHRGRIHRDVPLPGRGHGFAADPATGAVAVFARRPGDWALVLDPTTGRVSGRLAASTGRHFYGHGAFSPDGTFLYTSENRFEDGAGVIGVWEAARGWRRVGEWPSHGVGPHEICRLGRSTLLAVANGGVRTHPDTGRAKLNLDTMAPSLAIVDTADGRRVRSTSLDAPFRLLSIRHLDTDRDGRIVAAMQHQGARTEHVPLIAFERGGRLVPAHAPGGVGLRMRGYAGSVSFDASGGYAAVTHPHEGIVTLWAATGPTARLLSIAALEDVCGVARGAGGGSFIATGANGQIASIDVRTGRSAILARSDGSHWDNHLLALRHPRPPSGIIRRLQRVDRG